MYLVQTFKIVWLGIVIELIFTNCKAIATYADLYITHIYTGLQLQMCN